MNGPRLLPLPVALAALLLAAPPARCEDVFLFQEGHLDIYIDYRTGNNTWDMRVDYGAFGSSGPFYRFDQSLLMATADSYLAVPSFEPYASAYSFLGPPGGDAWQLPESDVFNLGLLEPGFDAGGVPTGIFTGNSSQGRVQVSLVDFSGPGNLFLYQYDSNGFPKSLLFDTRNAPYGSLPIGAGDHAHYNWDFTARGIYLLTLQASGNRTVGGATASAPATLVILVHPDPIDIWRAAQFYTLARSPVAADDADADGDRLSTLEEYAFGGHPLSADAGPLRPRLSLQHAANGTVTAASLHYRVNPEATDLTYRPRYSTDLLGWNDVPPGNITTGAAGEDGFLPANATVQNPGARCFLKLDLSRTASY